jgi:hypothetical protein
VDGLLIVATAGRNLPAPEVADPEVFEGGLGIRVK